MSGEQRAEMLKNGEICMSLILKNKSSEMEDQNDSPETNSFKDVI